MNNTPLILCAAALAACATTPVQDPPMAGSTQSTSESSVWEPTGGTYGNTGHRQIATPVSQPVTFESPTIETGVRPIYIWHEFPTESIFGGGSLQLFALQLRFALNERLAIIATKDGYINLRPTNGNREGGFADLAGGLKYALIDNADDGILLTGGLIYESRSGDSNVLQGEGDGVLRPFVSFAKELDSVDLLATFGWNQPIDRDTKSTTFDYHGQINFEASNQVVPYFAVHGITYTENGARTPVGFEGVDLANLGATMVAGQSVFSGSVGARLRATPDISFGLGYDFPLGGRKDILEQRVTVDAIFTF